MPDDQNTQRYCIEQDHMPVDQQDLLTIQQQPRCVYTLEGKNVRLPPPPAAAARGKKGINRFV